MKNVRYLELTGSTNDDAIRLAADGAPHGSAVVAAAQESGRGRLGKKWISPPGSGLYCSIVLRPELPFVEFSRLTLTTGLALCLCVEKLLPHVEFGLKWPNDLYHDGLKCGGILVESSAPQNDVSDSFVVAGIGLNVNTAETMFPETVRDRATSLALIAGHEFDMILLFHKLLKSVLHQVKIHETAGFAPILREWRKRDILLGRDMQWVTKGRMIITGRGLGPDATGQLLAEDSSGRVHEILSGDVQLADSPAGKK